MLWQNVTDPLLVFGIALCLLVILSLKIRKQRAKIRKLEASLIEAEIKLEDMHEGRDYYRNLSRRESLKRKLS